ncbi:MAG: HAS-barrel domain-containing protein [Salinibacter sp.]
MDTSDAIGEVIESSTRRFVAEVYEEAEAPAFGTWVRVPHAQGTDLFGLVSHVETGSYDSNRQAVALGLSPEERAEEMPMVQELLRTTVRVQLLACRDPEGDLRQTRPPHPPDIHDFMYPCPDETLRALGVPADVLRTLVEHPDPAVPVDDLLVAVLRSIYKAHGGETGGRPALVVAGRTLSRLLDDDHERLQSILRRVL